MSEFKGTPGKWYDNHGSIEAHHEPYLVATVTGCCVDGSYEISDANARLIAAAPELLEALQWVLPLAKVAIDSHRMGRIQGGHTDIRGTYKNGETWVGIYQDEIDKIENAIELIQRATTGASNNESK